jgi:NAD(P)H-dependent FMN reductase
MTDTRVLVLVGSLRADSFNRRLAEAVQAQAPVGVAIDIAAGLGDVPFYNEDIDGADAPATVVALRDQVAAADRVLVVTPEYNGTMPAVLNNALDWTSRPFGEGSLKGKPLAVVGASVGQYGGQWAHEDTRRSAKVAGATVVEDIVINHRYEWGTDPVADADLVQSLVDAVAKLAAYESVA